MQEVNSLFIGSFEVFKKALKRHSCSTPVEVKNKHICCSNSNEVFIKPERGKMCFNFPNKRLNTFISDELKEDSFITDSEGFASFTSKSYNGDVSDEADTFSNLSCSDESVYYSAVSNLTQDEVSECGDQDSEITRNLLTVSTIIYRFDSAIPLHCSMKGNNELGMNEITSEQLNSYMKNKMVYTQAKILQIEPDPSDELNLICMQCSKCLQFCRLQSNFNQEPAQYVCPQGACEADLYNPVFNIKLTLEIGHEVEELLLVDQNAVLFFGVHPLKYLTDQLIRRKVVTALEALVLENQKHWFCITQDYESNQDRITQTSLLYFNNDENNYKCYYPKLYKYKYRL